MPKMSEITPKESVYIIAAGEMRSLGAGNLPV